MLDFKYKDPVSSRQGCIIWLHGLGADISDMMMLAEQYPLISSLPFRHVFVNAPFRAVTLNAGMVMRAWYDIFGLDTNSREDNAGVLQAHQEIQTIINQQIQEGFNEKQIILAGFSQGGAMALYTALHAGLNLGGVISLSSYLPLRAECKPDLARNTPIFLGSGKFDQVVLPLWTQMSYQWLLANGYSQVTWQQYPIEHSICLEELLAITTWLLALTKGISRL